MYIFLGDTETTHNFLKLLEDKAHAGLEVVIIADALGSRSLRAGLVHDLQAAGAEFIYFSHWFRHTHRKILIIDNKVAFLGGVNISGRTRNWLDVQIRLQGRIVRPLLKSFAYAYQIVGGQKESILQFSRLPLVKKIKSWITDNVSDGNKIYNLDNYYKTKLAEAKISITIVTPYLLPPRWLLVLLDDACRRGVKVEILIPNDTDIKPINKVNYLNACRLAACGVKFYLMPLMNHAKIMLIDGEEGVIGSQNMDVLSFNFNIEAGVFFRQKDLVSDLTKIVANWRAGAVALVIGQRKISFTDHILINVLRLFYTIF
jgi:cardiolipin synthase